MNEVINYKKLFFLLFFLSVINTLGLCQKISGGIKNNVTTITRAESNYVKSTNVKYIKRNEDPAQLHQKIESKLFDIYPNPSADNIYLENHSNNTIKSLRIYNEVGNLIQNFDFVLTGSKFIIDIESLDPAIYVIVINYFDKVYKEQSTSLKFTKI